MLAARPRWLLYPLLALAIVLCCASLAKAQTSVTTFPLGATSTNASSTIALANTYQQVFASNASRRGCTIQNTSTSVMYVFFGAIGSATNAKAFPLFPAGSTGGSGGFISCISGGIVLTDQVSISGSAGTTFTAASQ